LALGVVGCAGRPNFALSRDFAPATMFLTWQNDPTTTMTVQWLEEVTEGDAAAGPLSLHYSADGNRWRTAAGERKPFGSPDPQVCRIEITGLRPDTDYRFVIDRRSPEYHFRPAPATLREGDTLRFAAGGDAGPSNATRS